MNHPQIKFVPNRIDRDPPVIMGVTGPEVYAILWLSLPAFLLFLIFFGMMFSSFVGGVFSGVVGAVMTLFGGVLILAHIKRNKPPHYILHQKLKLLEKLGISSAPFVYKSERFRATREE